MTKSVHFTCANQPVMMRWSRHLYTTQWVNKRTTCWLGCHYQCTKARTQLPPKLPIMYRGNLYWLTHSTLLTVCLAMIKPPLKNGLRKLVESSIILSRIVRLRSNLVQGLITWQPMHYKRSRSKDQRLRSQHDATYGTARLTDLKLSAIVPLQRVIGLCDICSRSLGQMDRK